MKTNGCARRSMGGIVRMGYAACSRQQEPGDERQDPIRRLAET